MRNAHRIETEQKASWHISSLLVTVRPEDSDSVCSEINKLPGADVARIPTPTKIIITLETTTEAGITANLDHLQKMPGVVTAALIFHQSDVTDLDEIMPDSQDTGRAEEIRP